MEIFSCKKFFLGSKNYSRRNISNRSNRYLKNRMYHGRMNRRVFVKLLFKIHRKISFMKKMPSFAVDFRCFLKCAVLWFRYLSEKVFCNYFFRRCIRVVACITGKVGLYANIYGKFAYL